MALFYHYVVRYTQTRYGCKLGEYARGQTPTSNGSTPDLQKAYVYNTRMQRRVPHHLTGEQLEKSGYEIIPVEITPKEPT